jgi:Flp pilus assembly pilin Flp
VVDRFFSSIVTRFATFDAGALAKKQDGQTLVEYALILVTISIGVLAAMTFLRNQINAIFTVIGNDL